MIQPPDGGVVLGPGGTFKVPGDSKQKIHGWAYRPHHGWTFGWWWMDDPEYLFATAIGSEIALLNGHETLLKCTRCRKTSPVDPDKLVCPQCGEDYSSGKGESDTPRTDAEITPISRTVWGDRVSADFARTLERELRSMTIDRDSWEQQADNHVKSIAEMAEQMESRDAVIRELYEALEHARSGFAQIKSDPGWQDNEVGYLSGHIANGHIALIDKALAHAKEKGVGR